MATSRPGDEFLQLLDDIRGCIEALCNEFRLNSLPINDDNANLHILWMKFECFLEHQLKEKHGLLGSRKTYWDYFCKCLASKKIIHDGLKYVKSANEVKTSAGRGRTFIRFCLVNNCLADTLQQCLEDDLRTREYFSERSVLFDPQYRTAIISALYDLNEVEFDLSTVGHDLDSGWPTFAMNETGITNQWNVPSRTMSVSSLSSQSSERNSNIDPATDVTVEKCDIRESITGTDDNQLEQMENSGEDCLKTENEHAEGGSSSESELIVKIDRLEAERDSLRAELNELKTHLESKSKTDSEVSRSNKDGAANKSKAVKELESLRIEVKRLSDENVKLDEDNTLVHEQLEKWKKCFKSCTEKLSIKNKINEHLERQVAALKEAMNAMKEMLAVKTIETTKLRDLVSELKSKSEQIPESSSSTLDKTKLDEITAENQGLCKNIAELNSNVEHLKRILDDKGELIRQRDEVISDLEQTVTKREETVRQMEVRLLTSENNTSQLLTENQNLKSRLETLGEMVQEIDKAEVELENLEKSETEVNQDQGADSRNDDETGHGSSTFTVNYMLCDQPNFSQIFPEIFVFNKTLKRLRCLITEKQDLQLKLKSSNDLNSSLINKVKEQENKLSSVTFELSQTKALIEQLKSTHKNLQTSENMLHYELKEKRVVVEDVKRLLNLSRAQWLKIRQKQSESEFEWKNLRADFASRVKQDSIESGFTEEGSRNEPVSPVSLQSPQSTSSADIPALTTEINDIDPPPLQASSPATVSEICNLSLSHGDDDVSETSAPSKLRMRLQLMEEQSRLLYCRLVQNLKRSESLERKLSHLHEEHGGESSTTHTREEDDHIDLVCGQYSDDSLKNCCDVSADTSSTSPDLEYPIDVCEDDAETSAVTDDGVEIDENSPSLEECLEESLVELSKPQPLELAQTLPKRVELLRKSKENLQKSLDELLAKKLESEAREAVKSSEVETLRSNIDYLNSTVQRLESEKLEILRREEDLKAHVTLTLKQARQEGKYHYDEIERSKNSLQEKVEALYAKLLQEEIKYKKLTDSYHQCLAELNLKRDSFVKLRFQPCKEVVNDQPVVKSTKDINEDAVNALNDVKEVQEKGQVDFLELDKKLEWQQQQDELDVKTLSLSLRDDESNALCEELKKTVVLLDKKIKENNCLSASIDELKTERVQLLRQIDERRTERLDLKRHLTTLIKNKDLLWNYNKHLTFIENLLTEDRWEKDNEVNDCLGCKVKLSLIVRKSRCQYCGRNYCESCCSQWMTIASQSITIRVCNECFKYSSEVENKSTVSANEFTSIVGIASRSANSIAETSTSVDLSILEQIKKLRGLLDVTTSEQKFEDITDEEIARCLYKLSPYSFKNSFAKPDVMGSLCSIDEIFATTTTNSIVIWVSARTCTSIPILIDKNADLIWEFSSEPKSVAFRLMMEQKSDEEILERPICYVHLIQSHSNVRPVKDILKVRKPGVYMFCFDNKFSKFVANKVTLTITKNEDVPIAYHDNKNENVSLALLEVVDFTQEAAGVEEKEQ
ncbi:RUN and FYVE domain containing 4 [Chamberlinius hualienensis]